MAVEGLADTVEQDDSADNSQAAQSAVKQGALPNPDLAPGRSALFDQQRMLGGLGVCGFLED